ncbi:MAG: aromatic ring-opening dioxygenase LigA [Actinomycetota bacterium]|nr:MAG: aromatic ring-opening dioxygenase LigA [Actinomycetota bacterium]
MSTVNETGQPQPTYRTGGVRTIAILVIVAGAILLVAGVVTYGVVSSTLAAQKITVSDDATHFAGQSVTQPWQAYAEAEAIAGHAEKIAGGKTYAELPQGDPNRDSVMTASFLQASLFTSVVAFGVAAMAAGLGAVVILIGVALLLVIRRPVAATVVSDTERGEPAHAAS